jgi:hypothetical protein
MKRMIIVVSLFVMLFVAVSPAFAQGPYQGQSQGFVQRGVQGWQTASWGASVVIRHYTGYAGQFGDMMGIAATVQSAGH